MTGEHITRRRTVAALGTLTLGLGGCQGLLGSSGDATPTESSSGTDGVTERFEAGIDDSIFEDVSQQDAAASATGRHAADGDWALRLTSEPGTSSACKVETDSSWSGPHRFGAAIKPLEVGGPENSIGFRLLHTETDRSVSVFTSGYFDATRVVEVDENGEQLADSVVEIGSPLPEGEWTRIRVATSSEGLEVGLGDSTHSVAADWTIVDDPVSLGLQANAWGSGDPVDAAFDDVRIAPR